MEVLLSNCLNLQMMSGAEIHGENQEARKIFHIPQVNRTTLGLHLTHESLSSRLEENLSISILIK